MLPQFCKMQKKEPGMITKELSVILKLSDLKYTRLGLSICYATPVSGIAYIET